MGNDIVGSRNKLTEQLLGMEIAIRFISMRQAKDICLGDCDDALLEWALHVPIRLAIDGENDIPILADALGEALRTQGASAAAARSLVSLFLKKNRVAKIT